jgi:VanZ family protein
MALIFVLSAQSQLPTPEQRWVDFVLEKSAHFIEYAVLAALILRALDPPRTQRRHAFCAVIVITWLFALSDEFHQSFVPGREADWSDVMVDWVGATIGASLWTYRITRRYTGSFSESI